jgi:tetratricopeptide (TPR) repeat protein
MTALTLAVIVRDEARRLPDFLDHHAPLAEETVVVDTGSTDGSAQLAAAGGARVHHHRWRDDFAAARNASLDRVRTPWVMILDCDELVATDDFSRLRQALAAPAAAVWLLETRNYLPDARHLEWQPLPGTYPEQEAGSAGYFTARRGSLFPNRRDLRFSGRVHESVLPAAAAAGLPLRPHPVPIHHFGHLDGAAAERRRQRDLTLVAAKVEDDPGDVAARLELGSLLLEAGDTAAAQEHLAVAADGPLGLRPAVRARLLLARLRRQAGDATAAGELLAGVVREDPGFLFGWLELVRCRGDAGAWMTATELVEEARDRFGADNALLLRERLRCHARTGRLADAAADAARLAERYPQWMEIAALHRRLRKLAGGS